MPLPNGVGCSVRGQPSVRDGVAGGRDCRRDGFGFGVAFHMLSCSLADPPSPKPPSCLTLPRNSHLQFNMAPTRKGPPLFVAPVPLVPPSPAPSLSGGAPGSRTPEPLMAAPTHVNHRPGCCRNQARRAEWPIRCAAGGDVPMTHPTKLNPEHRPVGDVVQGVRGPRGRALGVARLRVLHPTRRVPTAAGTVVPVVRYHGAGVSLCPSPGLGCSPRTACNPSPVPPICCMQPPAGVRSPGELMAPGREIEFLTSHSD